MAVEGMISRVSGRLGESALRLRRPSQRIAGSVRTATCTGAIIVAAYTLTMGSVLSYSPWSYRPLSALVQTSSGFAFITAIMDIALIFGLLVKEDKVLKYILCATMAVYIICGALAVCTFLGTAFMGYWDVPLWEIFRFGVCMVHLGVMYSLLAELRGDLPPEDQDAPPPADGWLKNNLSHQGPPAPACDDALLKVHVPRAAVLSPSSCTTAAPVHPPASSEA